MRNQNKNRGCAIVKYGLFAFLLFGCSDSLSEYIEEKCVDMKFERFIKTDKVIIADNRKHKVLTHVITDKEVINKIVRFSLSHNKNWIAPFGITPISPIVNAVFYSKGEFIGNLGIRNKTLVSRGCGYFYSKIIANKERDFILDILLNR